MNMRIKKLLAVLLSAIMVVSAAFVSTAEIKKYESPEINREDTVKTTGKWKKDKKGVRRLETENGRVKDGWYYANKPDSSTEYGWYHFDENGNMSTGWIIDKKDAGIWYYTGETKDGAEGSLVTGWVTDPQDGKKYYMDPATGVMSSGWKKIGSKMYYFGERQYADVSWTKDANGHWTAGKGKHSFGTMYANEFTPDGYWVGANGAWKQPSAGGGSSGGGSSYVAYGAEATTSTAQYAGTRFDPTGLKLTVYKNGAQYKTVSAKDSSVTILKILTNGKDDVLEPGPNDIEISFLFKDGFLLTGQTVTTRVVGKRGLNTIPKESIYLVDTKVPAGKYKFYDKNGYELKEWKTMNTSEAIVTYLAAATGYVETGDESTDYFYMYVLDNKEQDTSKKYTWTYRYNSDWGPAWKHEFIDDNKPLPSNVGAGKENTKKVLTKEKGAYITNDTVWNWIDKLNSETMPLGYNDWFIPSKDELEPLKKVLSDDTWSSTDSDGTTYDGTMAWYLHNEEKKPYQTDKSRALSVIAVRSF